MLTQKNANAYGRAYLTSLERFRAAKQAEDKAAANLQVEAMGRFSALATAEAQKSAVYRHQWQKLRLERTAQRRAELKKKGLAWQDEWKAWQQKLQARWSEDFAPLLRQAGLSQKDSDRLRDALVELSPEQFEKSLGRRTAQTAVDEAVLAQLKKSKAKVDWPAPAAAPVYDMMRYHAHLLHAELHGRGANNPKGKEK
jgi:hypothetical protein